MAAGGGKEAGPRAGRTPAGTGSGSAPARTVRQVQPLPTVQTAHGQLRGEQHLEGVALHPRVTYHGVMAPPPRVLQRLDKWVWGWRSCMPYSGEHAWCVKWLLSIQT